VDFLERVRDVLEEDQPQHDVFILGGVHVSAQLVRRRPQQRFKSQIRPAVLLCRSRHKSCQSLAGVIQHGKIMKTLDLCAVGRQGEAVGAGV